MITVQFTQQQFAYLQAAVERDLEDATDQIRFGEHDDYSETIWSEARGMLAMLRAVEQEQLVPF